MLVEAGSSREEGATELEIIVPTLRLDPASVFHVARTMAWLDIGGHLVPPALFESIGVLRFGAGFGVVSYPMAEDYMGPVNGILLAQVERKTVADIKVWWTAGSAFQKGIEEHLLANFIGRLPEWVRAVEISVAEGNTACIELCTVNGFRAVKLNRGMYNEQDGILFRKNLLPNFEGRSQT